MHAAAAAKSNPWGVQTLETKPQAAAAAAPATADVAAPLNFFTCHAIGNCCCCC